MFIASAAALCLCIWLRPCIMSPYSVYSCVFMFAALDGLVCLLLLDFNLHKGAYEFTCTVSAFMCPCVCVRTRQYRC